MLAKLDELDGNIEQFKKLEAQAKERAANEDDLEDFMQKLGKEKNVDRTEIRRLRVK